MKHVYLIFLALLLVLSACSPISTSQTPVIPRETQPTSSQPAQENLTRVDEQGAVVVEVTPMNLDQPGKTLDFLVSMNTHSVNLSMDLAQFATLATNAGLQVNATTWDGPSGGHHVSGTLSFPSSVNGKALLEGATRLTMTIRSVDAPERNFTWNINP